MKSIMLYVSIITFILFVSAPEAARAQSAKKYWVYFSDKGPSVPSSGALANNIFVHQKALQLVQPRAIARRTKVLPSNSIVDAADLPLYEPYLEKVQRAGGIVKQQVRFLNAASYLLTPEQITVVSQLPFVRNVEPVIIVHVHEEEGSSAHSFTPYSKTTLLDYGPSFNQVQMINVPPLHAMGVTGHGVLVGMLDTGFRWRVHESLQARNVIAEYDFIQHDSITANEPCDSLTYRCDASGQDGHGTLTMSTLGGYKPGQLIGPAFDADFILGKTEYVQVDDSLWEEDNWAAGIEWMESSGADVVSSSLGYDTFFDVPDYTWANGDFNGRTTVSAKAALRASELGVIVCNAMGNQGNGNGVVGTMLTPADADSIISVGAVTFSRHLTSFSSTGPTNDNATKPDVVSPGSSIY